MKKKNNSSSDNKEWQNSDMSSSNTTSENATNSNSNSKYLHIENDGDEIKIEGNRIFMKSKDGDIMEINGGLIGDNVSNCMNNAFSRACFNGWNYYNWKDERIKYCTIVDSTFINLDQLKSIICLYSKTVNNITYTLLLLRSEIFCLTPYIDWENCPNGSLDVYDKKGNKFTFSKNNTLLSCKDAKKMKLKKLKKKFEKMIKKLEKNM